MEEGGLRGLYDSCTAQERELTLRYFDQLTNSPNGWKICAADFTERVHSDDHVRFFCLRVLEHHVCSVHMSSSDDDILAIRKMLLGWLLPEGRAGEALAEKVFVRNKMAQIIALTFVTDYPTKWPSFFSDVLRCVESGGLSSVELYLRALLAIDAEIVDRQVIHSAEENARNTLIKDYMRDSCVPDLVASWFQIMTVYKEQQAWLTSLALQVVGAYVQWVEISLIANDRFVELIFCFLSSPSLRESAADCLHEIVSKGMDALAKVELVEGLQKLLESASLISPAPPPAPPPTLVKEDEADFQCKLSRLVNGVGVALVTSWTKLLKAGDEESAKVALQAIEAKVPYLHRYLSDEDDGVSEAIIPFTVQYLGVLKQRSNLSDTNRSQLQTLFLTVVRKLQYDEDYNFLNEGEDELLFLEFRKELKAVFDNIVLLDSPLMLQAVDSLLSSTFSELPPQGFSSVEVALRVLYLLGEVVSEKHYGGPHQPDSLWHHMMTTVFASGVCNPASHFAVLLQYFEVLVRFAKFFHRESQLIPQAMEQFLGPCGLRHDHCTVRSRASYLMLRFLKNIRNQLAPLSGQVLESLQELLLLPGSTDHHGYLSNNDLIFLYEAAGFLVAALPTTPEGRRSTLRAILAPVLEKFTLYLDQLRGVADPAQQEELSQVIHYLLSFMSRTSKVYSNHHLTRLSGCLECFEEVVPVILRGLEVDVQRELLQSGVRQYLHRMIICLGDELLKFVPLAVSLLLKDCVAHDLREFIPLINQLIAKYKERIAPFLREIFMPIVQSILTCLNMPFDPAYLEEHRERKDLQKAYFTFVNSITANDVTVVIAEQDSQNLEEVLRTIVQGAVESGDPGVQKVCFSILKRLVDVWSPDGALTGFVEYMYSQIIPACFLVPLSSTFDLNDGQAFLTLGEIAGVLKALLARRGPEAVAYLQTECLPSLGIPVETAQEFVDRVQSTESKALKTYFKVVFFQLRALRS